MVRFIRPRRFFWLTGILAAFILAAMVTVMLMSPAGGAPPSSDRSRAAVERVRPSLERDLAARGLAWGAPALIRIFKQEGALEVWLAGPGGGPYQRFRTYAICAWSGDLGPKLREGDGQAPEGFYAVTAGRLNPHSRFHLSFNLGYPNAYDRAHGRTGSALMVHGDCMSVGCYAMARQWVSMGADRNRPIEEIYALVEAALAHGAASVPVHALPFRFSAANLRRHGASPWRGFWANLREGDAAFRATLRPPKVWVSGRRYRFAAVDD
ncbi:MAG: murein L,D-transpeptidase [Rhodobacterales bacterium]|nr:murein L,D-transpeptidase [Rhodobacterales bacterium]